MNIAEELRAQAAEWQEHAESLFARRMHDEGIEGYSYKSCAERLLALAQQAETATLAYLVSSFVPGDPERDAIAARNTMFDPDQREQAQRHREDPGPVERHMLDGAELHVYRVVAD